MPEPIALVVAVDFDGTCVDHRYPDVGADVPGAERWLKALVAAGAALILWTMRSHDRADGADPLADAEAWFAGRDIPLWGVNTNPTQASWTHSPKAYAEVYVDDAAFGCPLRENVRMGGRPYVDWEVVGPALLARAEARRACPPIAPTPRQVLLDPTCQE